MKGSPNKKIIVFFAVLALMFIALVLSGCSITEAENGNKKETDISGENIFDESSGEKEGEKNENDANASVFSDSCTYGIGYIGNSDDPVYKKAEASHRFEDKEAYVHRFDSKEQVKSFLVECNGASNYYVQDIANAIYRYDEEFFETRSVFAVFIKYNSDGSRFNLSSVKKDGETLRIGIDEYISKNYFKRDKCWFLSFTADKKDIAGVEKYSADFSVTEKTQDNLSLWTELDNVELDFDVTLDYTTRSPEYSLKTVHTGLSFEKNIRDSALNIGSFSDNTTVHIPVHLFVSREELIDFWDEYSYPQERKDEVKAFLDSYGEEFFEDRVLITLFADQFGSDTVYGIKSFLVQANTMLVEVIRTQKGKDYSSGADAQILALSVKKPDVEKCYYFNAYIEGEIREVLENPPHVAETFKAESNLPADERVYTSALNSANVDSERDDVTPLKSHRNLPIHKFESADKLLELFGEYAVDEDGNNRFSKYDTAFFEKNNLFVVYLRAYSCDAEYKIDSIYITDLNLSLTFRKTELDGKNENAVWITTVEVEKKYGRTGDGHASVNDTDPPRVTDTKWDSVNEDNVYIPKYTSFSLSKPLDKSSKVFTEALNREKIGDTDETHIPFHLFKTYDEYMSFAEGIIPEKYQYAKNQFYNNDVYLLYIDGNMAENGWYQLTEKFVDGGKCTMAILGCNTGARIELSNAKSAWIVTFYCSKGELDRIKEFDAIAAQDLDELKKILTAD